MIVTAIDPGPKESAIVWYDGEANRVITAQELDNDDLLMHLRAIRKDDRHPLRYDHLIVERVDSFGLRGGVALMETAFWAGRFVEAGCGQAMGRKAVKLHLCGSSATGDADVRKAVSYRWGTDLKKVRGTKQEPGPLFGITGHKMSALAVAVVWAEKNAMDKRLAKTTNNG